ncbi:MAG: twin-arginine translocase TatA/TatE family subunit [Fimbriimonadaceae bacterium]
MILLLNSFAMLGTPEIIGIGVLILLFFGGAKIPQMMRGLGRGMGEFKKGVDEGKRSFEEMANSTDDNDGSNAKSG